MPSGTAPPTIPSVQAGTPPNEWSESVLASGPAKDTPTFSEAQANTAKADEKGKGVQRTEQPAATYSPVEKAKQRVSLPSAELTGARPLERSGGVGALPGNLSESSVALLPEERQQKVEERRSTSPRQRRDTIKPSAGGGGDEFQGIEKEEEMRMPGGAAFSEDESVASESLDAPGPPETTEASKAESVEGDPPARSGLESGLPEETGNAAAVPAVSGEPAEKYVQGSNIDPEVHDQENDVAQEAPKEGHEEEEHKARKVEPGYGDDYHPAQLHPPPPGTSVAESQISGEPQPQVHDEPIPKTEQEGATAEKKPGFMTMMKGEMKILAGKVKGDEHKVEEGKKLVHGGM